MVIETYFSEAHGEHLERIACPACGTDDADTYRTAHDRLFGRPGRYTVVRCRSCSMTYTNPRPTFASLARHYPDDYFCYDPPESLRGLRRFVLGSVVRSMVARRIRLLEQVSGRLAPGTRVCDVGCSHGALLTTLKAERSCDVTGVDFNEAMVAHCRKQGIRSVLGTVESASFDAGEFDVVTLAEYLEHEGRPSEVLAECRRITRPDGYLAIEVPLISSAGARLFGNYWSQLDLPRHLMFFTPESLERMLNEAGYDVVTVRKLPGSISMSLLHLLGYENIGRMSALDIVMTALATIPLLPLLPLLPEFMFVVARATRPVARLPAHSSPDLVPLALAVAKVA